MNWCKNIAPIVKTKYIARIWHEKKNVNVKCAAPDYPGAYFLSAVAYEHGPLKKEQRQSPKAGTKQATYERYLV